MKNVAFLDKEYLQKDRIPTYEWLMNEKQKQIFIESELSKKAGWNNAKEFKIPSMKSKWVLKRDDAEHCALSYYCPSDFRRAMTSPSDQLNIRAMADQVFGGQYLS